MFRKMFVVFVCGMLLGAAGMKLAAQAPKGGYVIQTDDQIAKSESGTHNGGGQTVGYSFFDKTPGMKFVFRKRSLKPGSGIGYHEQKEDEVYYVLSGQGVMTLDGKEHDVTRGTAILTRPGSSHGLKQVGNEDLVILIAYETR
jgi:mannose-6-phosphate isomerase-like protein (cupin superfamily)